MPITNNTKGKHSDITYFLPGKIQLNNPIRKQTVDVNFTNTVIFAYFFNLQLRDLIHLLNFTREAIHHEDV